MLSLNEQIRFLGYERVRQIDKAAKSATNFDANALLAAGENVQCVHEPCGRLCGEQNSNTVEFSRMARRPDRRDQEMLSEENLKELRYNLAHLGLPAVREFYETAYRDCRLVYNRLPSPRQIQTLVQVWKQLWKWR